MAQKSTVIDYTGQTTRNIKGNGAGLLYVYFVQGVLHALLVRDKPTGKLAVPGGARESGDTRIFDTANRETREETKNHGHNESVLDFYNLKQIQDFKFVFQDGPSGKISVIFVILIDYNHAIAKGIPLYPHKINNPETTEICTMSFGEFAKKIYESGHLFRGSTVIPFKLIIKILRKCNIFK